MILDEFESVLDRMVAMDPGCLADSKGLVALHRCGAKFESVLCATSSAFERDGGFVADGAQSATAWLATSCHLPEATARRELRLGRAMAELPAAEEAFKAGEIGSAQMGALARLSRGRCGEAVRREEKMLVDQAKHLRFSAFERCVQYFAQRADEDGAETSEMARAERREVSLVSSIGGMWFGKMTLDPISGEIVSNELERLEAELYEADRATARRELGREPLLGELLRTSGQRRADALVAMARRSAGSEEGASPAPLLTVLVDYETLHGRICEVASGTAVSPGSLVPYLDRALIERAVFRPGGRVEVAMRSRLFSGATRRAIELRDQRCVHPFCDRPAASCQVDHIVPFDAGGLTFQENGRLLCPFHNRLAYRQWRSLDAATRAKLVERQRLLAEQEARERLGWSGRAGPGGPDRAPPSDED